MLLGIIWTVMMVCAVLFSCMSGTADAVAQAALDGASGAVGMCIGTGGIICLWCAVMELMRECGIASALSDCLKPILKLLFPKSAKRADILEPLSANVSANLLGLGNAATPMGIRAARGMATLGKEGVASDELCRFVVLNTASVQLLPTTVAAIRAEAGAAAAFDILPAVWISSAVSVAVGLIVSRILSKVVR